MEGKYETTIVLGVIERIGNENHNVQVIPHNKRNLLVRRMKHYAMDVNTCTRIDNPGELIMTEDKFYVVPNDKGWDKSWYVLLRYDKRNET